MSSSVREDPISSPPNPVETSPPENASMIKAAAALLNQIARTLKTCRLYDANNPTVIRFRADLCLATRRVVDEHGPVTYTFRSDDVLFEDNSLYPARSRDDNLALPFYRDGVRSLTLTPGIEPREVDAFIDAVLNVTGQHPSDDDLVTLLWEAQLSHVEVDYVPGEGDMGTSSGTGEEGPALPWPSSGGEPETSDSVSAVAGEAGAVESRSDDWSTGELTIEIEAGFEELHSLAPSEVKRFLDEYAAEHEVSNITATLAIMQAYLASGAGAQDRSEIARFLPRVLRQTVTHGRWLEAREALALLRQCEANEWSLGTFSQELLQPISISSTVERVDQQEAPAVLDFISFAREFGDPAVDWLNQVLAESQNRRNRRLLAEAIADLCRNNPERLAPWLSDPRWFVVRNVVHILGWIGGNSIVGLLQSALRHPDVRVRHEVVAALGQVEPRLARPLLMRLLEGADTRMFCMVLHQLSCERDGGTARLLMGQLIDEAFEQRPPEEKRAVYSALSAVGGDEIVAELETELYKGNWFSRGQESHRQAIARCIARLGTPLARAVLERGVLSKRVPIRRACEDAMTGFNGRD